MSARTLVLAVCLVLISDLLFVGLLDNFIAINLALCRSRTYRITIPSFSLSACPFVRRSRTGFVLKKVNKLKVGFFYSATYMVQTMNSRAVQSQMGQLIDKSQWC